MMHKIVTDSRAWRALEAEREKLARAQSAHTGRFAAAQADYERAVKQHAEDSRTALLNGEAPGPAPTWTPPAGDVGTFRRESERLRQAQRDLLRRDAEEYEHALARRERELLHEGAQHARALERIAQEAESLRATAQAIRAAEGAGSPPYGLYPGTIRPADLLAILATSESVLRHTARRNDYPAVSLSA